MIAMVLLLGLAGTGGAATTGVASDDVSANASAEVAQAQAFLKHRRLYDGEVHGRIDQRTAAALRRYQMMHRLRPSGRLDAETEGRMSVETRLPSLQEEDRRFLETVRPPSPPPVAEQAP